MSVEDYPDLKFGFEQIDDCRLEDTDCPEITNEYNCGDVILVDLSHFDPSQMTSMNRMFCRMENLQKINFGDIRIENVTSMNYAFEWVAAKVLDLTNIDFSKVTDAKMMTYSQGETKVILAGCDLSRVKTAKNIFDGVAHLNLDGALLSDAVIEAMGWYIEEGEGGYKYLGGCCKYLDEISMRDCDVQMIESVIRQLLTGKPDHFQVKVII